MSYGKGYMAQEIRGQRQFIGMVVVLNVLLTVWRSNKNKTYLNKQSLLFLFFLKGWFPSLRQSNKNLNNYRTGNH